VKLLNPMQLCTIVRRLLKRDLGENVFKVYSLQAAFASGALFGPKLFVQWQRHGLNDNEIYLLFIIYALVSCFCNLWVSKQIGNGAHRQRFALVGGAVMALALLMLAMTESLLGVSMAQAVSAIGGTVVFSTLRTLLVESLEEIGVHGKERESMVFRGSAIENGTRALALVIGFFLDFSSAFWIAFGIHLLMAPVLFSLVEPKGIDLKASAEQGGD